MNAVTRFAALVLSVACETSAYSQCQVQKLVASDAQALDFFGSTVALEGDWAAIAAPSEDDVADNSGAVYMFQRVGGNWIEIQKLKASDADLGNVMGASLALAGDTCFAGAPLASPQGVSAGGAVYLFERVAGSWTQTAKLLASDLAPNSYFGSCVALSGNRLLVGASEAGVRGAAYVFDRVGSAWVETARLTGSDTVAFDEFGQSVALSGDRAIVGARNRDGLANAQGAAYVYELGPTGWVEVQELRASSPAADDLFGVAVAILDSRAVVGAVSHDHPLDSEGVAYAFERTASGWIPTQELQVSDPRVGKNLGSSVAMSGEHVLLGAPGDDDGYSSGVGSTYDFRWSGSTWIQAGKMIARQPEPWDSLGTSVAISGDTVLLGAPGDDDACRDAPNCFSGAAYIFELAPAAIQYGSCGTGAPCNNRDTHGGCRNSTGQGAVMAACGSGSISTDDLRLEINHCPPNKLTLLFMGPAQSSVPYGDGLRVAAPQSPVGIYRYGGAAADSIGRLMRGPGLIAQSQGFQIPGRIQSGQTWNFQYWYRDLQGPCHGLTNFSNGVQVVFGP